MRRRRKVRLASVATLGLVCAIGGVLGIAHFSGARSTPTAIVRSASSPPIVTTPTSAPTASTVVSTTTTASPATTALQALSVPTTTLPVTTLRPATTLPATTLPSSPECRASAVEGYAQWVPSEGPVPSGSEPTFETVDITLSDEVSLPCSLPGDPPLTATYANGTTGSIEYDPSQSKSPAAVVINPHDSAYVSVDTPSSCSSGSTAVRSITADLGEFGQVTVQADVMRICGQTRAYYTALG